MNPERRLLHNQYGRCTRPKLFQLVEIACVLVEYMNQHISIVH